MNLFKEGFSEYTYVFIIVNILECIVSAIMFLIGRIKTEWQEWIICLYGGFFVGAIPLFLMFQRVLPMLVGATLLSVIFIYIHSHFLDKIYIPLLIVLEKIILILGITFLEQQNKSVGIQFCTTLFALAIILFCIISYIKTKPVHARKYICGAFATMELCGSIFQLYKRNDYMVFNKEFHAKDGTFGFLLYLMKVDFTIYDFQGLFIIGLIVLFALWLIKSNLYSV